MTANNRLDKSYGPVGSSAGVMLFIAGLVLTCFYFSGSILIIIGAFVGFSYSSALIDFDKKRVKFSNNLFGIFPTGKWIEIEPSMTMEIIESVVTNRTYSRGNRSLDVVAKDFRLVLFNAAKKEIMPLKKTDTLDAAKADLADLKHQLGLSSV